MPVFNMLGHLQYQQDVVSGSASGITIPVSGWPAGIYQVRVESPESGSWSGKLVVVND